MHSAIERIEPPPTPAPESMRPIEEPVYQTPDPYLRNYPSSPFADLLDGEDGVATLQKVNDGHLNMPVASLYGVQAHEGSEGRALVSMPASEWFCGFGSEVSWQAIAALADMCGWSVAVSLNRQKQSVVVLDCAARFLRPARADGRRLQAEGIATEHAPGIFVADAKVRDADGRLLALFSGSMLRIDAAPEHISPETNTAAGFAERFLRRRLRVCFGNFHKRCRRVIVRSR